jgi:hypothetical protein
MAREAGIIDFRDAYSEQHVQAVLQDLKAFEALVRADAREQDIQRLSALVRAQQITIDKLEQALAAQPAVPEGWKLVREWAEKWASITYEDSWKYAAREVLTMLATTPLHPALVSLTDEQERKVAKLFNDRVAAMCHVDAADHWKHHSDEMLDEVRFVLNAAHGIAAAPEKGQT